MWHLNIRSPISSVTRAHVWYEHTHSNNMRVQWSASLISEKICRPIIGRYMCEPLTKNKASNPQLVADQHLRR